MRIVALAFVTMVACSSAKGGEMATNAFDCARAADLLGLAGSKVEGCKELLPSLWRVVLTGGSFAPGWSEVRQFRWVDGKVSTAKGMGALADALRDMKAAEQATLDSWSVSVLLDTVEGAPPGFSGDTIDGNVHGVRGGVTTKPLTITLVTPSYQPHDGGPPGGGPPGGPPGGGPPGGGVPMPQVARATLTLDASYHGQWVVELRLGDEPFEKVETIPVAPSH